MNGSVTVAPLAPAKTGKYPARRAMNAPRRAGNTEVGTPPPVPAEEEVEAVARPAVPPAAAPPTDDRDASATRRDGIAASVRSIRNQVVDIRIELVRILAVLTGIRQELVAQRQTMYTIMILISCWILVATMTGFMAIAIAVFLRR